MSVEQLILGTFNKSFNKYFHDELVVGQLAHTEFKSGVKKGDEVDVQMPVLQKLFDYTGGDLPDAEETNTSTAQIRIDKGKAFHFEMNEIEQKLIKNAPNQEQQVNLAKEYTSDAIKQFAATVDTAYGKLFTRAGHYLDDNGSEISKG